MKIYEQLHVNISLFSPLLLGLDFLILLFLIFFYFHHFHLSPDSSKSVLFWVSLFCYAQTFLHYSPRITFMLSLRIFFIISLCSFVLSKSLLLCYFNSLSVLLYLPFYFTHSNVFHLFLTILDFLWNFFHIFNLLR